MKTAWSRRKLLVQVLVFITGLNFIVLMVVRLRYRHYDPNMTEAMLATVSSLRPKRDSPCEENIIGQPYAESGYVKLHLNCNGEESVNTFDLRAIKNRTAAGLLVEFARIGSFEVEVDGERLIKYGKYISGATNGWFCLSSADGFEAVVEIDRGLVPQECLYCYYDDYKKWRLYAENLSGS